VIVAVQPHMFNSDFGEHHSEGDSLSSYPVKQSRLRISAANLSLCQESKPLLKTGKLGACRRFRGFKFLLCELEDFSISFIRYGLNKSSKFAYGREKGSDRMSVMPMERSMFI
jgi:hypothetical protein